MSGIHLNLLGSTFSSNYDIQYLIIAGGGGGGIIRGGGGGAGGYRSLTA